MAIYLTMTTALLTLAGCRFLAGTHRDFSRSASKTHYYEHQQEFVRLASEWAAGHGNDELVYNPWNEDEVRWNSTSILKQENGYLVRKEAGRGTKSDSFASAAKLADADAANLESLVFSLRKLNASSIHVRHRGTDGNGDYVVVGLQESGADYGYLYVPNGHDEAQALVSAAQKQPNLVGMERVEQIAPRWFYFEGKGAL